MMLPNKFSYAEKITRLFFNDSLSQRVVMMSLTSPDNYFKDHEEELYNRGIEKPFEGLFWIAVVNRLIQNNMLAELDWKDYGYSIVVAVKKILNTDTEVSKAIIEKLDDLDIKPDADVEETMPLVNKVLNQYGLSLIQLDIDSDSYPLTIIEAEKIPIARELTSTSGIGKVVSY